MIVQNNTALPKSGEPGYRLASRIGREADSVIDVGGVPIGGREFVVIAGPCAVESREQMERTAEAVAAAGAACLRGGAFKPRASPYSFQGLGEEGLRLLREVSARHGLPAAKVAFGHRREVLAR